MKVKKRIEMLEFDFGGDLFIDVGGNIGLWTKELCDLYNKIIFIEPSFDAIEIAKSQIKSKNVTYLNNLCLAENNKKVSLYSPSIDSGQYTIHGNELYSNILMKEEDVLSITLDSLIDEANGCNDILIKIDTEGAEIDVLEGALNFIERYNPNIFVETHFHMYFDQKRYDSIINKLKDIGYTISEFKNIDYLVPATIDRVITKNLTGKDLYNMHYQILMTPLDKGITKL